MKKKRLRMFPKSRIGIIRMSLILCVGFLVGCYSCRVVYRYIDYEPANGDVIFQALPRMDLVDAIEGCSGSPYSHCGIVLKINGNWIVREALGDVHDTPLALWILRGRNKSFDVYRLKKDYSEKIPKFVELTEDYLGLPYDIKYEMDSEKIYCSELVYKSFYDATTQNKTQSNI